MVGKFKRNRQVNDDPPISNNKHKTLMPNAVIKTTENKNLVKLNPREEKRFWEKIVKGVFLNDCWCWTAYKNIFGYGRLGFRGKLIYAHQLSYLIHIGTLDKGFLICHSCDNPECCNPLHLWKGTYLDNNRDRDQKGRFQKMLGSKNGSARLSERDVEKIRLKYKEGGIFQRDLAKEFRVSRRTVGLITRNMVWRHL